MFGRIVLVDDRRRGAVPLSIARPPAVLLSPARSGSPSETSVIRPLAGRVRCAASAHGRIVPTTDGGPIAAGKPLPGGLSGRPPSQVASHHSTFPSLECDHPDSVDAEHGQRT